MRREQEDRESRRSSVGRGRGREVGNAERRMQSEEFRWGRERRATAAQCSVVQLSVGGKPSNSRHAGLSRRSDAEAEARRRRTRHAGVRMRRRRIILLIPTARRSWTIPRLIPGGAGRPRPAGTLLWDSTRLVRRPSPTYPRNVQNQGDVGMTSHFSRGGMKGRATARALR
jgi:hypothetical protein